MSKTKTMAAETIKNKKSFNSDSSYFSKDQLGELLNKIASGEIQNKTILKIIGLMENSLLSILYQSLDYKQWSFEHLLTLAAGCYFRNSVTAKMRKHNLTPGDVKNAAVKCLSALSEYIKTAKARFGQDVLSPAGCLEKLLESNFQIPPVIIMIIRLHHYKLNYKTFVETCSSKKPRPLTFDINQAITFLNTQLGLNLRKQNILEMCASNSFGAYINAGKYSANYDMPAINIGRSVQDVDQAISCKLVDLQYLYSYEGLIRLIKQPVDQGNVWANRQSIKYLRDVGTIIIKSIRPFFQIQPSLCDYILGFNSLAKICNIPKEGIEISIKDLLFVDEELQAFVKDYMSLHNKKALQEESTGGTNSGKPTKIARKKRVTNPHALQKLFIKAINQLEKDNKNISAPEIWSYVQSQFNSNVKEYKNLIKSIHGWSKSRNSDCYIVWQSPDSGKSRHYSQATFEKDLSYLLALAKQK